MRAIEDLLTDVRDRNSREQFADAVRAYSSGALRAAVVSTWVAVALDLTSKIRELADLGEAAAVAYIARLDAAIASRDLPTLAGLERDLLVICRDTFALIGDREKAELDRLQADRHVCAHPAYVSADEVFAPTAELCRLHMRSAVDAVLSHPPAPGRALIERFFAEAKGAAWPADRSALAAHLDARYLRRGKPSLRRNLAQVIVKGCIDAPDGDELVAARMAEAAHALHQTAPELLAAALDDVVRKREETSGLSDLQLLRLLGAIGSLGALWEALPETSHPRAVAAVQHGASEDLVRLRVTSELLAHSEAATALAGRLAGATTSALISLVTTAPGPALLPAVLDKLSAARGWRIAEEIMALIPPLARHVTVGDLKYLAEIIKDNDQVRESSGVPQEVINLFERTKDLPGALAVWSELSEWLQTQGRQGDPTDYYAYPGLASAVAAATPS